SDLLQVCDTALANCNDVANADGNYFLLAQSASYVYMTKDGSSAIYAFAVADNTLTEVSGVTFPANFDHHHHTLSLYSDGGHGSGLFRDFFNLMNAKSVVTEGDSAYVAINYDLDTQEPVAPGPYDAYGLHVYLHKHAMVLKLTGTEGVKVYDNGDGIDHGNASNETDTGRSLHLSLNVVRDGNLLLEGAHFNGGDDCGSEYNCMKYVQGWLNTNDVTTTKTAFDNTVLENDIPYLTAYRVPPVVIGDHAYLNQSVGNSTSSRVYTVYKMPLGDIDVSVDDPSVTSILGRMYFERTAFGSDGTFDGSVLLWERSTGDVIDATNNVVIGNDSDIKAEGETLFSVIARSSTDNRAGVGGLFGLKMSAAHGATPYLVSGASNSDGSLVKVNHISGSWIID
ncbi:MAG TPA: cadherin repeat domain-containing protein, partial [Gammaproteobacteria bacterium]|nr:cadherin repeat domain-containing protein [Gammaproteobacteria bacterium]